MGVGGRQDDRGGRGQSGKEGVGMRNYGKAR